MTKKTNIKFCSNVFGSLNIRWTTEKALHNIQHLNKLKNWLVTDRINHSSISSLRVLLSNYAY